MAKNREVNYFAKINSDEDLEKFLVQHNALIILDVYQDLFGPCTSLHGTLESAKLTLFDSDKLQLAVCDAGKVEMMKRFRFKCQPTMVFCAERKVVDIVYGANIPLLKKTIKDQLDAHDENIQRDFYDFDEPLPFERVELDIIQAQEKEAARLLKEKMDLALYEKLDSVSELMQSNAAETGVTLFMPHVADVAWKKTLEASRILMLNSRARKIIQLTQEMVATLNYKLNNPIEDDVMNYLIGKDILAVLWTADPRKQISEVLNQFVRNVSEPMADEVDPDADEIAPSFIRPRILDPLTVYLDAPQNVTEDTISVITKRVSVKSHKSQNSIKIETEESRSERSVENKFADDDERPTITIPPVWTPANQFGNFMFMYTLFRSQFDSFLPLDEEPDPPCVLMVFSPSKRSEILRISEEYQKDLLALGFFTSDDINTCSLICKTAENYEELPMKDSDRIIAKVSKKTSKLELALSTLNPLYVSQNATKGSKECSIVFDEAFAAAQDVLEKKPEKHATRRKTEFSGTRKKSNFQ